MRKTTLTVILMIVALLAAACYPVTPAPQAATGNASPTSEQPVSGTDSLNGTSWTMATLNGQPALKDTTVTLNFAQGRLAGSDGCNDYSTAYTADGSNLKVQQPIATTLMACPDPIMNQASAYMQALQQAHTYKTGAGGLTLFDATGKPTVTFSAQSTALAGTSWQVMSYNNGKQAVVSVLNGTTLTANFGQDGQLAGNAGCNDYSAGYQTNGTKISIGPATATRMMCAQPQGVMEQEAAYLAALPTAATYRIDGKTLELRTADGALVASFAGQSTALAGSAWQVLSYNNGKQAVVSVTNGTTLTANFGQDGQLTGNAGCNDYNAGYQVDGQKITIGPASATRKACDQPPGVMDQEQAYLAALGTAATYRMDGAKLELRTADGALAAQFTKAAQ